MAGSPMKQARKTRWQALQDDPGFAQDCINRIACGDSIRALATEHDVPISTFHDWITREHGDSIAFARRALAANLADLMMLSAERVEAGELDPKAASAAASIRQWLASRYDRELFGDRSQVDMRVQGSVDMHLAAVRELTQRESSID
ncbi:hypothetical protein ACPF7Z_03850 [Halomonas sp. GXIMD04776]|uniref:terminase small subunit-like protein n=1 Tax=Halomonas sp. GXIMD04776 TaxID=3415605 RepID=UPI003C94A909